MKKLLISTVALTLALAGAASPAVAGDWTGGYFGAGIGWVDVRGPGTLDGDDTAFGLHAGYDFDMGDFVLGGEFEYSWADIDLGAGVGTADGLASLKFKAGYDFGDALGYLVLGSSRAYTSLGDDTGLVYGLGVSYQVNEMWMLSSEFLHHEFDNFAGSGADASAEVIALRASFRF